MKPHQRQPFRIISEFENGVAVKVSQEFKENLRFGLPDGYSHFIATISIPLSASALCCRCNSSTRQTSGTGSLPHSQYPKYNPLSNQNAQ